MNNNYNSYMVMYIIHNPTELTDSCLHVNNVLKYGNEKFNALLIIMQDGSR